MACVTTPNGGFVDKFPWLSGPNYRVDRWRTTNFAEVHTPHRATLATDVDKVAGKAPRVTDGEP